MKKLLYVLVAIILAFGLMAGCTDKAQDEPEKTTEQTTETQKTETVEATQAPAEESPYMGELPLSEEKVTLSFATHQGTNSAMAPPSNDLPIYQWLEEITNVNIDWQTTPIDNYKEVMSARLASSDKLPDMINLYDLGNYEILAEDDVIIAQNDLIDEYGYYINLYFEENPAYKALVTSTDGKIYAIENTVLESALSLGFMVNKFAMERAEITDYPKTATEFYDMLTRFKTENLNYNGEPYDIPLVSSEEALNVLGSAFGLEITWDWEKIFTAKDGQVVCNYTLPEYKEYIAYLNKLYSEGLLNKDYDSASLDTMYEYISSGETAVAGYWTTYMVEFSNPTLEAQDMGLDCTVDGVSVAMPPLGPEGKEGYFIKRSGLNGDGMGISVDCPEELQPVAMKWISFLFNSPESLRAQSNGIEGMSYTVNDDGTLQKTVPDGMDITEWSAYVTSLGGNQPPRAHQQNLDSWRNSWMYPWMDAVNESYQPYYKDGAILPLKWTAEEEEAIDIIMTDLETYIDENIAAFIKGTKSMDEFDAFVTGLDDFNIDELQGYYQTRYERQMASMK